MNILIPGQYPRSEALVAASRNFDRKRISKQELENAINADIKNFKALQWGLPYISPGYFNWQDLMRPFRDIIENSQTESLKRFYETNSFWRQLEVEGKLSLRTDKLDEWIQTYFLANKAFSPDDPLILTLPFIYLFKEYSKGLKLEDIAEILDVVCDKLIQLPNVMLCFSEPSFGWEPLSDKAKTIGKTFLEKLKKKTNNPIFINSYFFSIEKEKDFFFSLPVDGFGIDFYSNSLSKTLKEFPKDKTLLAGVISTDSTLIESQQRMESFLKMMHNFIPQHTVYFTPSGPAELLPREMMDKKIKNLQELILCLHQHS